MLSMLRSLLSGPSASASADEAAAMLTSGAILIDVRDRSEWESGHARGAVHVPLGAIHAQGLRALESKGVSPRAGDTLLLICHSGMRSGMACQVLGVDAPFKTINVRGGVVAWQRAGLPMERGS
jgi:rhodanese-related sulfurtransferase